MATTNATRLNSQSHLAITAKSLDCEFHHRLQIKNEHLQKLSKPLNGAINKGITRDLVNPVDNHVAAEIEQCKNRQQLKEIKEVKIPILKKQAQEIDEPIRENMTQLLKHYEEFISSMDSCTFDGKLKAEREIRAWIEKARNLILKKLETTFPNEYERLKKKARHAGAVYWIDWIKLANKNNDVDNGIYEIVKQLFGFEQAQWEKISKHLYSNLSENIHTKSTSSKDAIKLVDLLYKSNEDPERNILLKKLIIKVSEIEIG